MIFISYRRADSAGHCNEVADLLEQEFGEGCVFRDLEKIPPAREFQRFIDERLEQTTFMLVLIGRDWLEEFKRRLARNSTDFVLHEVSRALKRGGAGPSPVAP